MKINKVQNNTNFKSGLTPEILKMEKMTQSAKVAEYFKTSPYSDRLDFEANLDFKACRVDFSLPIINLAD